MEDGPVSAPYVVLCEGSADRAFINRLLQSRGITDIAVRCTHTGTDPRCAGRSGLKDSLLALDAVRATIKDAARGIAIVFDGDDDTNLRFNEIIEDLKQSKLGYPRPSKPLEIAKGDPSVGIALLPCHLDELIFNSLGASHKDLLQPIEDFQKATVHRTEKWKNRSLSRMRLRCLIAASHEPDPGASLTFLLESSKGPVDFQHSCFDWLMDFLTEFRNTAERQ
ncbi:MAG TPA: DUF3226 domain-containing protein [Bryobacteraceae bacterium]|jgi:hypothetical protein|nr:DUF3226 domain-containing protein [Bryobacteraceae bacterium]